MKRILIAILVSVSLFSCVKVEEDRGPVVVEYGYFADSYYYTSDNLVLLECTVDTFLEGESMVSVWIRNKVWSVEKEEFTLEVELTSILTTNDFQRELRRCNRLRNTDTPVQFVTSYRGLEISWDMFDEIYSKYCREG